MAPSDKSEVMIALGGDRCPDCGEFVALEDRVARDPSGRVWLGWCCKSCRMKILHELTQDAKKHRRGTRDYLRMIGIDVVGEE